MKSLSQLCCHISLSIEENHLNTNETSRNQGTGEFSLPLMAKIVGSSVLSLLCLSGILWFGFRYRNKSG